jgi:hypothetical protein
MAPSGLISGLATSKGSGRVEESREREWALIRGGEDGVEACKAIVESDRIS